ncbi:hypothetical protein H6P81_009657 [Aristolochia fimbriata]|uniref:Flavanone 4-reductase n=1 Tax=Aristolochia fimbriata TaxID=158543 RepID=A0AAV7ELJ5_ARIFI|nr:hypothetical protein H6P81_009657 [Aristolochia fimbriata]
MEKISRKGAVVVTGASGFVGSWLLHTLLCRGYTVRATLRDPCNLKKTAHLWEIPGAKERLTLWKAHLSEEGSFQEAIDGTIGVFHVATPMDFNSTDPEKQVIKPTVDGVLNVLRSCKRAGTVKRVVFTSSAGTVNVAENRKPIYDESSWSDVDFIRTAKMTGWMYFASKTLAEKAAWEFAGEEGIDLISIIPTLVVGPFIMQGMPPSMITALALLTRNEPHYSILKQLQVVHLHDLCDAHVFLFERPEARGRYICSSHDTTILALAKMLKDRYPEYDIPQQFEGVEESLQTVSFSSKKLTDMGFKFRYSLEEMYEGAIRTCREKGLIPLRTAAAEAEEDRV